MNEDAEILHSVNDEPAEREDDDVADDTAPELVPFAWRDYADLMYDFSRAEEPEERDGLRFEVLCNIRETLADLDDTIERGFQKLVTLELARRNNRNE